MKSSSCCCQQSDAGSQEANLTCGAVNFLRRLLPALSSRLFSGLLASFDGSFGVGRRDTAVTLEGGKNTRQSKTSPRPLPKVIAVTAASSTDCTAVISWKETLYESLLNHRHAILAHIAFWSYDPKNLRSGNVSMLLCLLARQQMK